jgi:hypothetical protein
VSPVDEIRVDKETMDMLAYHPLGVKKRRRKVSSAMQT